MNTRAFLESIDDNQERVEELFEICQDPFCPDRRYAPRHCHLTGLHLDGTPNKLIIDKIVVGHSIPLKPGEILGRTARPPKWWNQEAKTDADLGWSFWCALTGLAVAPFVFVILWLLMAW